MACACCQPPPEGCVCEDTCSYFIELVSPLAVKHGPYPCQVAVSSEVVTDSLIEGLIPYALSGKQEFPGINNASVAISSNTGSLLSVEVVHASKGFIDGTIFGSNRFSGGSTAAATVSCSVNANGVRRYYANLGCSAHGEIYAVSGGEATTTGYWEKTYLGQFEIPATCISAPNRSCVNLSAETLHITTPLEITFSGNGTSSLGSLALISNSGYGVHSAGAQSAVESILGGLSYTVRITSKPSCRSVSAICDIPLEGNRIVVFGTAVDRNFVLGVSKSTTTGPLANDLTWTYEHFGPADGTTQNPYVFNAKLTNENNRIIAEHNVELFCDGGQSGGQWYARESIYCTPNQGQETEDQWIGIIESYASANDCNEIAAGDPVPIGTPYYEHVDGYPIVNFGDPCVPPSPIGLEITAYCP